MTSAVHHVKAPKRRALALASEGREGESGDRRGGRTRSGMKTEQSRLGRSRGLAKPLNGGAWLLGILEGWDGVMEVTTTTTMTMTAGKL